ncbi:MAG TPA: aminotransferase class V-fold PLP-dependent enzyme [Pirellulales bacterium]|jgi:isopenicillin-N epimerase|nr:aminotransferase class V-fold PLP-dependent enzyme [Pirellulales bacterium]
MSAADWADARDRIMLDPTVAYLNTGSFGPLPRCVFDRVTALRRHLAEEPMDFLLRAVPPLLWEARERLAGLLGGDPHRLVFTANVSAAVNLVASSLPLEAPGEILLTDHEYDSMHWCWERAAQRRGLTIRTFPLPTLAAEPGEIVAAAVAAMRPGTRLFFFSHILSPTGMVLPARQLCAEARRRGIVTVVDGAHAPGFIDLNLADIPCDFYGGNCHKWLLAPTGTGFLYLGPGNEDRLEPMQVSWGFYPPPGSGPPDMRDPFGSTPRIRRLEFEGTRDVCPWLVVPEAIDFQNELGHDRIRARIRELTTYVRSRLIGWRGLALATPEHPDLCGAMTALQLPEETNPAELRRGLWERFRVEVPVVERPDRLMVRASTHFFNTEAEVERLAEALAELVPR